MPNDNEPKTDISVNPTASEEIVDPTIPEGNKVILKRHPFGIVVLYIQSVFGMAGALALVTFLISNMLSGDTKTQAIQYIVTASVLITGLTTIFLVLATYIYQKNSWVITDDSITQTSQTGLFHRQISELSMANIEDVTSEQNGILAQLFGFGTLKAETAGERSNFYFNYCPNPNKYAKIILHAREMYIENEPDEAKRANELLNVPRNH